MWFVEGSGGLGEGKGPFLSSQVGEHWDHKEFSIVKVYYTRLIDLLLGEWKENRQEMSSVNVAIKK